jgi:hypothetical protein
MFPQNELRLKWTRARVLAPLLHLFLFVVTWLAYWLSLPQPLMDGPAKWPFMVLVLADVPISITCFGMMFSSDERFWPALVLWAGFGTLWWFLLGIGSEKLIGRISKAEQA